MSNPTAVTDVIEGPLMVVEPGTKNVAIVIVVDSDPCPTVVWMLNGSAVAAPIYSMTDQCNIAGQRFTFTLSISMFTESTTGHYSAEFTHVGGSTHSPSIFVTVTGTTKLMSIHLHTVDFQALAH
jgi:hypothetical protein